MRILHLNTNDRLGGAARSAYRLFKGEENLGIYTRLLTLNKTIDDSHVITYVGKYNKFRKFVNQRCNSAILKLFGNKAETPWNTNIMPYSLPIMSDDWDILHLHWINGGFITYSTLAGLKKPIVWTLHDSWAFTGGCHIPYECKKYEIGCKKCPQLLGKHRIDLAKIIFKAKQKYYPANIAVVCPSSWLADCARKSKIFRNNKIHVIPNGLDMDVYKPLNKKMARELLGIPEAKKVILFGAVSATSDRNKGYAYLLQAINILKQQYCQGDIELLVFGGNKPDGDVKIPYPISYLGHLFDDISLVVLYSAADVMIVPSKSENFPNSVLESMSCGTPCVAFNIGGIPDLIMHKENGYLAKPYEAEDIARGIKFILEDKERRAKLSEAARKYVAAKCDIRVVAKQHKHLYEEILSNTK